MSERADISRWLRERTPQHLDLLDRMRASLLHNLPEGSRGIPDRDWARIGGLYLQAFNALLAEERERAKLALMARLKGGGAVLTDEEFENGIRDLALQAIRELSTADLVNELTKRGLTLPAASAEGEQ